MAITRKIVYQSFYENIDIFLYLPEQDFTSSIFIFIIAENL